MEEVGGRGRKLWEVMWGGGEPTTALGTSPAFWAGKICCVHADVIEGVLTALVVMKNTPNRIIHVEGILNRRLSNKGGDVGLLPIQHSGPAVQNNIHADVIEGVLVLSRRLSHKGRACVYSRQGRTAYIIGLLPVGPLPLQTP